MNNKKITVNVGINTECLKSVLKKMESMIEKLREVQKIANEISSFDVELKIEG